MNPSYFFNIPVPDIGIKELDDSEDHVAAGEHCQYNEPEPKEDVDFLVENVHSQNAESVKALDRSGPTIFVKNALGHLGENS